MITLVSFGFRNGTAPSGAGVVDVRVFKNPHNNQKLRALCGLHKLVQKDVMNSRQAHEFVSYHASSLELHKDWVLALGCFAGRHRSVAFVEAIARELKLRGVKVNVEHRDNPCTHEGGCLD